MRHFASNLTAILRRIQPPFCVETTHHCVFHVIINACFHAVNSVILNCTSKILGRKTIQTLLPELTCNLVQLTFNSFFFTSFITSKSTDKNVYVRVG